MFQKITENFSGLKTLKTFHIETLPDKNFPQSYIVPPSFTFIRDKGKCDLERRRKLKEEEEKTRKPKNVKRCKFKRVVAERSIFLARL